MSKTSVNIFLKTVGRSETVDTINSTKHGKTILEEIYKNENADVIKRAEQIISSSFISKMNLSSLLKEFLSAMDITTEPDKFFLNTITGIPNMKLDTHIRKNSGLAFKPYGNLYVQAIMIMVTHLIYEGLLKKEYISHIFENLRNALDSNNKHVDNLISFIKEIFPDLLSDWILELKTNSKSIDACEEFVNKKYPLRISKTVNSISDIIFKQNPYMGDISEQVEIKVFIFDNRLFKYGTLEYLYNMAKSLYGNVLDIEVLMRKFNLKHIEKSMSTITSAITNWVKQFDLEVSNNFIHEAFFITIFSSEVILHELRERALLNPNNEKITFGFADIYKAAQSSHIISRNTLDTYLYKIYIYMIYKKVILKKIQQIISGKKEKEKTNLRSAIDTIIRK